MQLKSFFGIIFYFIFRFYINWTRLVTTGVAPMIALIYFNSSIFRGIQVKSFQEQIVKTWLKKIVCNLNRKWFYYVRPKHNSVLPTRQKLFKKRYYGHVFDDFRTFIFQLRDLKMWSKNVDINKTSKRHLFEILIWLDFNKTTACCIKTLRHFLLVLEALICLVGKPGACQGKSLPD
jgi:hypothetical protein